MFETNHHHIQLTVTLAPGLIKSPPGGGHGVTR